MLSVASSFENSHWVDSVNSIKGCSSKVSSTWDIVNYSKDEVNSRG